MPYFGRNIRTAVFGQSHAAAIGVTIDGLPAGEAVDAAELEAFNGLSPFLRITGT